jgi:SpoVK/Ycf46/Vps4 family AAA+-type ATPase
MVEKIEPVKCEQAIDAVQGCGDPSCPICLPSSGGGGSGGLIESAFNEALGETMETARMDIPPYSRVFDMGWMMDRATSTDRTAFGVFSTDQKLEERRRLEQAEAAAREPIKEFILQTEHEVTWEDVVGNEEAHRAMIEAIEFPVKHKETFKFYGKKSTKGILLKGPPGCGKTMLGKAAASVIAKLHGKKKSVILNVPATKLQSPYVGKTEKKIRQLFAYARAYKALHGHQLVLFIDEADAVLPARNGSGAGTRDVAGWEESNVATFLSEMDGMEESGALVILATNRPHAIDGAILRDGRIDRKITVQRPNAHNARVIFERAFRVAPVYDGVMVGASDSSKMPSLDNRHYLVNLAMEMVFDPLRRLLQVKHEKGVDFLTLGCVVSGAMMVGLVERIKANAFHRDIEAGELTGIMDVDVVKAIERLTEEQREAPDLYALGELAQRIKAPVLEIDQVRQPEIKYTGTLQ